MKWPGVANLESRLACGGDAARWEGQVVLDGLSVGIITAIAHRDRHGEVGGKPYRLARRTKVRVFQGSIVLGMGFVLAHGRSARH